MTLTRWQRPNGFGLMRWQPGYSLQDDLSQLFQSFGGVFDSPLEASLEAQFPGHLDLLHLARRDDHKAWQVALVVEQQMQLHGTLGALVFRPVVERGAQVDHGRVQGDPRVTKAEAADFSRRLLAALVQRLKQALVQLPRSVLVSIGQGRTSGSLGDSQVAELAFAAGQSPADLP